MDVWWPTEPWMTLGDDGDGAMDRDWPKILKDAHPNVTYKTLKNVRTNN